MSAAKFRLHAGMIRDEFLRLLTKDSESLDRRRKDFNMAIFMPEEEGGHAVWTNMNLGMVLEKFDTAVKRLEEET